MKVALVHDWLTGMRGGERCLEQFIALYPQADIYTLVHLPGTTSQEIDDRVRGTSFLQHIPGIGRHYRKFLPAFPLAASSVRISGYDLVISLSHAAAKNVVVDSSAKHVCYCFTPMRYIWDMAPAYLGSAVVPLWPMIRALRWWDVRGASRVDAFVGISNFVASRIRKFYGRRAAVIYPPVETERFEEVSSAEPRQRGEAFLFASAFVAYKGAELVVRACNELSLPLWCVGGGPLEEKLRAEAGPTITFLGRVSDADLVDYYARARALIFPAREDFGIMPIEALAAGTPVIGGYHGALRETIPGVRPWLGERFDAGSHAGVFYPVRQRDELTALCGAIEYFQTVESSFRPQVASEAANRFSVARFRESWREFEASGFSVGDMPKRSEWRGKNTERWQVEERIVGEDAKAKATVL